MEESTVAVQEPQVQDKGKDLVGGTVCVIVSLSTFGNRRKVNSSNVQVKADKDLIHVSKTLLDSEELKAVLNINHEIRMYILAKCLPFVAGVHLLPLASVPEVEDALTDFREQRRKAIESFVLAYPALCEKAATSLQALYNPSDYPPVEGVSRLFDFSWQYVGFGPPGSLRKVSAEIFKNEQEKAARLMSEAASEVQQVMRATLAEMVNKLRESLEPDQEGKTKRLTSASVEKLREFLNSFDIRNVLDDQELKVEVERARTLLGSSDAASIRTTEGLRDKLAQGMSEVGKRLETMVGECPRRKIRAAEEEEAEF